MQSTNHWPGRTMQLHTYSVLIGEWFLWSLWYCLLLETGLSGVITSVMTTDTPMTSVEILFMVLNYSLTAAISWHTPSDSAPALWQLYCLVTWKQYHCLRGRQNDNKFIFIRSLDSLPSLRLFSVFFWFSFLQESTFIGTIFSLLAIFQLLWCGCFPICNFFLCAAKI